MSRHLLSALGIGESWAELLGALFQASQSNDAGHREGAFRIFATTPGIIKKQHEETVQGAFAKGFKDDDINVGRSCSTLRAIHSSFTGTDLGDGSICILFQSH